MSPYQGRIEAAWCNLDHMHFVAAQTMAVNGLNLLTRDCLDAPDVAPAGSMLWALVDAQSSPAFRDEETKQFVESRNAMAERIIAEILAEEAAEKAALLA